MTKKRKIILNTAQTIERTALTQLVTNEEYARKVLPHMKGDYFHDKTERTIFEEITKFVEKYDKVPTQTSLEIEVQGRKDLNEEEFKKVVSVIKSLKADENVSLDWLVDVTEEFCKDKAVYNAIVDIPFTNSVKVTKTPSTRSLTPPFLPSDTTNEFTASTMRLNTTAVMMKIVSVRALCCNSSKMC